MLLSIRQSLPVAYAYERTCNWPRWLETGVVQVLMLCFRFPVSGGALARACARIAKRCEPTYEAFIEYLRRSAVVHADETGWYIANATKKAWLWVFATPEGVTIYAIRLSRGGDVPGAILGEAFGGTLVVDGWSVYPSLGCPLAQCNAHLLRRCAEMLETQRGEAALFPQQVKDFLQQALQLGRARELTIEVWGEGFWQRTSPPDGRIGGHGGHRAPRHACRHPHHEEARHAARPHWANSRLSATTPLPPTDIFLKSTAPLKPR